MAKQKAPVLRCTQDCDKNNFDSTLVSSSGEEVIKLCFDVGIETGFLTLLPERSMLRVSGCDGTGTWALRNAASWPDKVDSCEEIVRAWKPKWWRRNFHLCFPDAQYVMTPVSASKDVFQVFRVGKNPLVIGRRVSGDLVGRIASEERDGNFNVAFDDDVRLDVIALCTWIAVLMYKRKVISSEMALYCS